MMAYWEHIVGRGVKSMSKQKEPKKHTPTLAPGLDDQEELEQSATNQEIETGEYTSVTTLSYDEVDPSR